LLVFTALEFARMNITRHTAVNAAYEGARRGMVPGASAADARNVAQGVLDVVGARGTVVTVDPSVITPETQTVTVDVDVDVEKNGWLAPLFFRDKHIRTSCTLKREVLETVAVP
jgi:hypothetical protein